jgi:hypothetical protein
VPRGQGEDLGRSLDLHPEGGTQRPVLAGKYSEKKVLKNSDKITYFQ